MLGKRQNKKCEHDDGAMGFLNVLKYCRRRGYALELLAAMGNRLRCEGKLPFAHIEEDNCKSMNLALKLGFKKYGRVSWVKLSNGFKFGKFDKK